MCNCQTRPPAACRPRFVFAAPCGADPQPPSRQVFMRQVHPGWAGDHAMRVAAAGLTRSGQVCARCGENRVRTGRREERKAPLTCGRGTAGVLSTRRRASFGGKTDLPARRLAAACRRAPATAGSSSTPRLRQLLSDVASRALDQCYRRSVSWSANAGLVRRSALAGCARRPGSPSGSGTPYAEVAGRAVERRRTRTAPPDPAPIARCHSPQRSEFPQKAWAGTDLSAGGVRLPNLQGPHES